MERRPGYLNRKVKLVLGPMVDDLLGEAKPVDIMRSDVSSNHRGDMRQDSDLDNFFLQVAISIAKERESNNQQ